MELVQCVYCSASLPPDPGEKELAQLLAVCRENNARSGISGMLLFHKGTYFQILEGDRPVVERLLVAISKDPRHAQVTKILLEPIEERAFADWTMGHARVSARDLAKIEGLNDFFSSGKSLLQIGEGRARQLLEAFKDGRWRLSIS